MIDPGVSIIIGLCVAAATVIGIASIYYYMLNTKDLRYKYKMAKLEAKRENKKSKLV